MSIYCTFSDFNDWEHSYPQPYTYLKSHVLPSPDDPRAGFFDLGLIPGFITRDGVGYDGENEDAVWPYLRVSLRGSDEEPDTIILDREQVRLLQEALTDWLGRVKEET